MAPVVPVLKLIDYIKTIHAIYRFSGPRILRRMHRRRLPALHPAMLREFGLGFQQELEGQKAHHRVVACVMEFAVERNPERPQRIQKRYGVPVLA